MRIKSVVRRVTTSDILRLAGYTPPTNSNRLITVPHTRRHDPKFTCVRARLSMFRLRSSRRIARPCRRSRFRRRPSWCCEMVGDAIPMSDQRASAWKTITTYPYTDATGKPLFFVVRKERVVDGKGEKTFRQYRLNKRRDKVWNLEGVSRVPYHLPELIAAIERGDTIVVTEGEKDVDNLRALGIIATTNACGATWAWTPEFAEHFRGASVVIVADNDEPGRKAARERSQAMLGIAREVRIIEDLPEVPENGDCSDLIAAGWTRERFLALFGSAALVETPPVEDGAALLNDLKGFIRRFVVMDEARIDSGRAVGHPHTCHRRGRCDDLSQHCKPTAPVRQDAVARGVATPGGATVLYVTHISRCAHPKSSQGFMLLATRRNRCGI